LIFLIYQQMKRKLKFCEQFFIDTLLPEFNIASTAGSLLGFKHSEESIAKMILAKKGEENPMYGKKHSPDTIAAIKLVEKIIICSVNYIQLKLKQD
jgi:hypothetical protein